MGKGLGCEMDMAFMVDSNAALGGVSQTTSGKLCHVWIGHVWVLDITEHGDVLHKKVDTKQNPADLLTQHFTRIEIDKFLGHVTLEFQQSRTKTNLPMHGLITKAPCRGPKG